jgi:hypothetical protein
MPLDIKTLPERTELTINKSLSVLYLYFNKNSVTPPNIRNINKNAP